MAMALLLGGCLLCSSCRTASCEVFSVEGTAVKMDTLWQAAPDNEMARLLAPYRQKMDSLRHRVVGRAAVSMDRERPEDLLQNLVADVLREAAVMVQPQPADMGLMNIGGLRNVLTQGDVTYETIFEILPFENSLCVLTLTGRNLLLLFENIAARGGEGVSGVTLRISTDGRLLEARVGGQPVEPDRLYTVATIDYLAEGNDGMPALLQAEKRECPPDATLRDLFLRYVERQTAQGKELTSKREGRIVRR
ncbi:MAG: 5'-nucleotidase C-terminal domain-containing protein [Bacteroides sp.]|nr:5'-nucleotidase C-terminal domain-containing protein [Bacteroides sp.]